MLSHEQRVSNQLDKEREVLLGQMEAAEGLGTDTAEIERMLADLKVQILEKGAERKAKSAEVCAGCNFGTVICLPCSFLSLAVSACHCAPPLLHQQALPYLRHRLASFLPARDTTEGPSLPARRTISADRRRTPDERVGRTVRRPTIPMRREER